MENKELIKGTPEYGIRAYADAIKGIRTVFEKLPTEMYESEYVKSAEVYRIFDYISDVLDYLDYELGDIPQI